MAVPRVLFFEYFRFFKFFRPDFFRTLFFGVIFVFQGIKCCAKRTEDRSWEEPYTFTPPRSPPRSPRGRGCVQISRIWIPSGRGKGRSLLAFVEKQHKINCFIINDHLVHEFGYGTYLDLNISIGALI